MAAVGLVGVVVDDEVNEVLRRRRRDRHQAAEIHQKAAVALQARRRAGPAGRAPGQAPCDESSPMAPIEQIVERARTDLDPVDGGTVGRDHRLVGDVAGQDAKAFVAFHHDTWGLRPTRNATGCDSRIGLVDRRLDLGDVGVDAEQVMRDAHVVEDRLDDAHAVARRIASAFFRDRAATARSSCRSAACIRPRRRGWR